MRISVLAVGRLKAGAERSLAEDYRLRAEGQGRGIGISRLTTIEFAESQAQSPAARMAEEARALAGALPPRAFLIALDERGNQLTSVAFAKALRQRLDGGTAETAFILGGPDGLAPELRQKAGLVLAFGAMTWPHRLARVMLFEQIYRAVTIVAGHPYHRA